MLKKWHLCFPIATFLLLAFGVFRVNLSESLPNILFLSLHQAPPFAKGQIVKIDHPILEVSVGKIIVGRPGDQISIRDQTLFLNEIEIGCIHRVSKSGREYHPISEGVISEGDYFVYTPHKESFDSRYQEFGLVKEEWIKEVLCPLF